MRPGTALAALAFAKFSSTLAQSTSAPTSYAPVPTGTSLIVPSSRSYTNTHPEPQFGLDDWDDGPDGLMRRVEMVLTYPNGSAARPRIFSSVGCTACAFFSIYMEGERGS